MNIGYAAASTIPVADGNSSLKYARGYTADIIREVFNCYKETKEQLKDFAPYLRKATLYDTCYAIWQFVHSNITYQVDPPFKQFIKSPARLYSDKTGDCKSFSVFIASCLYNLGIKGIFRFVSFSSSELPTHVYVVVPDRNGKEIIIIDAVLPWFDREKQYTYKHDYNMTEISRLSGVPQEASQRLLRGRMLSVMGEQPDRVGGFFSGLLGIDKKHVELWQSNLPSIAAAYLYVFIPDSLAPSMPPAVQDKRTRAIKSLQSADGQAGSKYSYTQAVNDIHATIVAQYGMEPLQLINATFGTQIGFLPIIAAGVALVTNLKNIFGHYGDYGFKFSAGLNPSDVAPAQSDWTGYATQTGSLNAGASSSSTANTLPTMAIPAAPAQPIPQSVVNAQSGTNWLLWGGLGLGAFLLLKK